SALHAMLFRLAGEYNDVSRYQDVEEREVGEALRGTLPQGKLDRYGAYDFIGRYFAFRYQRSGSVAAATNAFMEAYKDNGHAVERFRREFIRTFRTTLAWYELPLVVPRGAGEDFHALLATIQLVSTSEMLGRIDRNEATADSVCVAIATHWKNFAEGVLAQ